MPDLVFSLGGDISAFQRAMNLALTTGQSSAERLQSYFKTASDAIDKNFGTSLSGVITKVTGVDTALNALKIAGGVFAGFELLKAIIDTVSSSANAAQKEIDDLVSIASRARDAQVGATFFQGFIGSAKQVGLEAAQAEQIINNARDALETRIGEGAGPNVSSTASDRVKQNVRAGNLPAVSETDLQNAQSMEDRIRVILDLVQQLQDKGKNAAAFDLGSKVFGADFETKLRAGVDIIGQMRTALNGLASTDDGRVRNAEELANAQKIALENIELSQRASAIWADYQQLISQYNQGNLEVVTDLKSTFVSTAEEVRKIVNLFEQGQKALQGWGIDAQNLDAKLAQALGAGKIHDWLAAHGLTLDAGAVNEAKLHRTGGSEASRSVADHNPYPLAPTDSQKNDRSRRLPNLNQSASSPAESADEVETLIKSLDKSAAAEQGEAAAIGKSNQARQEALDLAKADEAAKERGSALTDAERTKVLAAADAYSVAKKQIDDFNTSQQRAAQQAQYFGDTFEQAVEGMIVRGASLSSVLQTVIQSLESSALKAVFTGQGPLASLLGVATPPGATGAASVGGLFEPDASRSNVAVLRGFSQMEKWA